MTDPTIDGSTARRCTAIVTNERRARLRHSVKFLVRVAFENTVGVVQNSADITAKYQYIRVNYNIAITILIEKHHTGYSSALLWLYSDSTNITLAS